MDLIEKAFTDLFPEKNYKYISRIKYNNRFNDYGANIRIFGNFIELNLSKKWYRVSEEIKIGLIQELLLKAFKEKKQTMYIDLYNGFIKKLAYVIPKTKIDPELLDSFNRVNEKYFNGLIEPTNLVWGSFTTTKLGSYDFKTDTIAISKILKNKNELLDYVMYHEMLHKKHKFNSKNGRHLFHSSKFKNDEKQFENAQKMEKELKKLCFFQNMRKLIPF